ncbi:helix-turn-helix domain-containing protein [Streptomyces sp. NBC_01334]|uniref:AraC-like ligand-binding domain-containing protein n=1 Tax=Streptomyces sp. NBC_01334 TaxID=2903827 RepID=UPI002E114A51|nr:helix-turn-helix domain-containing protein [Streptomyces sp. NBC_01334]
MAFTEFDTAELPAEYRFDWWREVVARGVAPTRITTDHAADFAGSAGLLDLGRLQFTTMSFPGLRSERTAGLIRRADPETYELALILAGAMRVGQGRNETRLFAGDFAMWTSSRPYSGQAESGPAIGDSRAIILHLPRALVPLPAAKVDRLLAVGIPARSGTGRVLAQFLGSVVQEAPVLDATERERLGGTSLDLATGFLAHHLDAQEYLPPEARHEMLLARVDRFVLDNLSDTRLTPRAIAAQHHISVRLLHQLFRGRDDTVAATIRRLRLERCRADLADPRLRALPVQDIGARWGLVNAATFSRLFRTTYGVTPGEYQRAELGRPA